MKLLSILMSLSLLGAAPPVPPQSAPADPNRTTRPEANLPGQRLIDPDDRHCNEMASMAHGRKGDGQFRREPADPDRPLPFFALDYEIDRCAMLVMTNGEVRRPPFLPQGGVRITPAN